MSTRLFGRATGRAPQLREAQFVQVPDAKAQLGREVTSPAPLGQNAGLPVATGK